MLPDLPALYRPFVDAIVMLVVIVTLTRLSGLRSFSKMSSFDFAVTVASGSVIAATVLSPDRSLFTGAAALVALFVVQMATAHVRTWSERFEGLIDNQPLLVMDGPTVLDANLAAAKMTRSDLRAKLREANVLDLAQVRAVVVETTGDVSVLHGPADGVPLSDALMVGVARSR